MKFLTAIIIIVLPETITAQLSVSTGDSLFITSGTTFSLQDNVINDGKILGTGSLTLKGTSAQALNGSGSFSNLELDNSNGASISSTAGTMANITGKYIPTSGILTTNGNMTLKSDANGTAIISAGSAGGNYISGKIILERFIPARRAWRMMSFPITSSGSLTINESLQENAGGDASSNPNPGYGTHITGGSVSDGFDQNTMGKASMKEFIAGTWQGISSTNQPVSDQDVYFLFVRGSRANNLSQGTLAVADNTTLRVSANVKQGDQTIALNNTGWQLVANPFASKINLDNVATSNSTLINKNFKYWDPKIGGSNNVGGFVTASYNGSSYDFTPAPVSSLSEFAQSFAAFYVDTKATGSLSVTESNKCNCGSDNVFRPMPDGQTKMRINLRSVNNDGTTPVVDGVLAVFNENFSNDNDQFDAPGLTNSSAENLSIVRNGKKFSIERRNAIVAEDTISLQFSNIFLKNYQFDFTPSGFDESVFAFLEDKFTGTTTPLNLSTESMYDFGITTNPASYSANRFRVILKKAPIVVLPVTITGIKATTQKNIITNKTDKINVEWSVENQINITSYEVERSSDGIQFGKLGNVAVNNSASGTAVYELNDINPINGANYYRVKIIERNGSYQYSSVAKVLLNEQKNIRLYQNPVVNNIIQLEITGQSKGNYNFSLFDEYGKKVMNTSLYHNGADGIKNIPVNTHLSKGIYNATVTGAKGYKATLKISIE